MAEGREGDVVLLRNGLSVAGVLGQLRREQGKGQVPNARRSGSNRQPPPGQCSERSARLRSRAPVYSGVYCVNAIPTWRICARLAFADHMDRLVARCHLGIATNCGHRCESVVA